MVELELEAVDCEAAICTKEIEELESRRESRLSGEEIITVTSLIKEAERRHEELNKKSAGLIIRLFNIPAPLQDIVEYATFELESTAFENALAEILSKPISKESGSNITQETTTDVPVPDIMPEFPSSLIEKENPAEVNPTDKHIEQSDLTQPDYSQKS